MYREKLLPYLNKIESGEIKRSELRELIEICCRIGVACLNKKYETHKKIFSTNGISFLDVAVDSVSPLFITNENLNLLEINKSLLNWENKITTESEAAFFIFSIIWKRVDQTVSQILSEIDPLFNKILNNILIAAKANNYKKIYSFGQSYLVETETKKISGSLISEQEFNEIPLQFVNYKYEEIIKRIFDYLKNMTNHSPAIPIRYIINRIKNLYINEIITLDYSENHYESLIYINQLINDTLEKMNSLIDKNYIEKNKLSKTEGKIFKKVIKDIAIDLTDGGSNRGIEEYLAPYLTNLTNHELKDKFHNIFDYLYRVLKKDLKNALAQNKFSQMA